MNYESLSETELIELAAENKLNNKALNIEWRSRYEMNFPYKLGVSGSIKNCVIDAFIADREADLLIWQQAKRLRELRKERTKHY